MCGLALFWPRSLLPSLGPPFWPSSWSTLSLLASGSSIILVSWPLSSSHAFPPFRLCHSESMYPWNLSLVVRYLRKKIKTSNLGHEMGGEIAKVWFIYWYCLNVPDVYSLWFNGSFTFYRCIWCLLDSLCYFFHHFLRRHNVTVL